MAYNVFMTFEPINKYFIVSKLICDLLKFWFVTDVHGLKPVRVLDFCFTFTLEIRKENNAVWPFWI